MIRVVGEDLMCFAADSKTLEPLNTSCYDPWAWSDPKPGYDETIHVNEWSRRRAKQREHRATRGDARRH